LWPIRTVHSVEKKQMEVLQSPTGISVFIPALFVVIGIALYAGCQFLIIGLYRRRDPVFLVFGLMCLVGSVYVASQIRVYQATTAETMVAALRQRAAVACLFFPLFLSFVVLYTNWRAARRWLIWISAAFAGFLVLDLISPYGIRLSGLTSIESISLPWGETLKIYRGPAGKWDPLYAGARILVFALAAWRSITLLRTPERRRAQVLGAYCLVQFAALLHGAVLVDYLGYRMPYVDEFAYFALVLIMSFRLGRELHSHTIASEHAVIELEQQISERKQVEQALRASEDKLRSIFETAPEFILTMDREGKILFMNRTEAPFTREQMIGSSGYNYLPSEFHDQLSNALEHVFRTAELYQYETIGPGPGDTACWYSNRVGPVAHNGQVVAVTVCAHDITARKRAEEDLRQARQQYEALVNSIDGIVWECDTQSLGFLFVSLKAEQITGYSRNLWLDEPTFWEDHLHPDDRDRAVAIRATAIQEERDYECEYRMVTSDGRTIWLRDIATVVVEDGRAAALRGLILDITERKLAAEKLRKNEEQLRQSQKMEAIGRLAGGVAHDFNNLLTAIIGYGQLLLISVHDEPSRSYIVEADKAAQRATSLTRQLLAFSRNQVMQPTTLNLNAVVATLSTMLRRLIREDIELVTVLSPDLGSVSADPGQIDQVVINLVVNASDAMPAGGNLTIETANVGIGESSPPEHLGLAPGSYVMLAMTDTGGGMDAETKARIFEPFFTTKQVGRGTGLGLSTVYGIVKQSGGQVLVQSELGHGTTFRVYLPRVAGTAGPTPESRVSAESLQGTETILLVEDEDAVRDLACRALEGFGYSVISARSGKEALEVCGRQTAMPDLLVTDVVMPQMSGPDLARALSALCPRMKILYISGYVGDAFSSGTVLRGIDLLPKPFTPERLAMKVREVLSAQNI
jgi:two-component system cell cycle sensor histidine kinase/response regulator CckA